MIQQPLIILTLLSSALADNPPPNTQSCSGKPYTLGWAFYSTTIMVPFSDGSGCESIKNHLIATIGEIPSPSTPFKTCDVTPEGNAVICNWRCLSAYGGTGTELDFAAPTNQAEHINQALGEMYPTIESGFDCPNFT